MERERQRQRESLRQTRGRGEKQTEHLRDVNTLRWRKTDIDRHGEGWDQRTQRWEDLEERVLSSEIFRSGLIRAVSHIWYKEKSLS